MAASPVLPKLVGQRVKRREDPRLIQGRGTYVDDIDARRHAAPRVQAQRRRARPDPLHRYERRRGDGRRRSGVHRRADRRVPRRRCRSARRSPRRTIAPWPWTRCATRGEPVAVVVARDRYLARDAADAIVVEYDPLPAVVDLEQAMTGQAGHHPPRLPEQPRGAAGAERHRRRAPPARSTTRRSTRRSPRPRSSSRSGW